MSEDRGLFVYAPPDVKDSNVLRLEREELHHLVRVRRAKSGDTVMATDGNGMCYRCRLTTDQLLEIEESLPRFGEPPADIYLVSGILKGDANRDVVDLAVQLGASEIHFFHGDRSEGRLTSEKLPRLERMAIEAMKQCGRSILPMVDIHNSLNDALATLPSGCRIFIAHLESARDPKPNANMQSKCMAMVIGPEGGLSESELHIHGEGHVEFIKLAESRLRTPVAVAAGLSFLLTLTNRGG